MSSKDKDSRGPETHSYTRREAEPRPGQKPTALCKRKRRPGSCSPSD